VTQYSEEFKKSIIAKMLPPNNVPVPQLVRETGIPKDTLYTWRSKHRKAFGDVTVQPPASGELSSEEKFVVVLETASLNEAEISEYCRRKGLYPQQVSAWRNTCMQAHDSATAKVDREKLRKQTKAIKQLEAELHRKEKALAEAAALLILQKKVQALWEDPEDGKSNSGSAGK
jgi:transposase-like protein